jgi:hypothetical protein
MEQRDKELIEEINKFQEKMKIISVYQMTDPEINKELTRLYVLLGDLLSMVRKSNYAPYQFEMKLNRGKRYLKAKLLKGDRILPVNMNSPPSKLDDILEKLLNTKKEDEQEKI